MHLPDYPLVLGHRGAPRVAPENTVLAFDLAMDVGADGVELDVQPAGDGTPVVIHDPTLDRTTDARGELLALGWDRLATVRAGGEPLPRLEEALSWAARRDAWVNVEVKSPGVEAAAVRAVRDAGLMQRAFFSSFYPGVVAALRRAAMDGEIYFLTERWDEEVRAGIRELRVNGVCLHHSIATPESLEWVKEAGLRSVAWTVDDPRRMGELFAGGVAAVITNLPGVGASVRAALYPGARRR